MTRVCRHRAITDRHGWCYLLACKALGSSRSAAGNHGCQREDKSAISLRQVGETEVGRVADLNDGK